MVKQYLREVLPIVSAVFDGAYSPPGWLERTSIFLQDLMVSPKGMAHCIDIGDGYVWSLGANRDDLKLTRTQITDGTYEELRAINRKLVAGGGLTGQEMDAIVRAAPKDGSFIYAFKRDIFYLIFNADTGFGVEYPVMKLDDPAMKELSAFAQNFQNN